MENSIISSVKDEASFSVNHTSVGESYLLCCSNNMTVQWYLAVSILLNNRKKKEKKR